MSWISIVLYLLTHITDIISIVKQIIALIHSAPHPVAELIQQKLSAAIVQHQADGNTDALKASVMSCCQAPDLVKE